jgi:EAL domain-containing protein (putative c-di-GMP-specific phosphodiesterase class I)
LRRHGLSRDHHRGRADGDFAGALNLLRRLKALGIRIGYLSLSYLQSFPFDQLEVDRSFI